MTTPTTDGTYVSTDWTVDPVTGRINSSPLMRQLEERLTEITKGQAHDLLNGHANVVAVLILAQLAHLHNFGPLGYNPIRVDGQHELDGSFSGTMTVNDTPMTFTAKPV